MDRTIEANDRSEATLLHKPFPWAGFFPDLVGEATVITYPYLGDTVYPQPPVMRRGPYYQRRIKRWLRAHPPYTVGNGTFFLVGREIWCHPDDAKKLREALSHA